MCLNENHKIATILKIVKDRRGNAKIVEEDLN